MLQKFEQKSLNIIRWSVKHHCKVSKCIRNDENEAKKITFTEKEKSQVFRGELWRVRIMGVDPMNWASGTTKRKEEE